MHSIAVLSLKGGVGKSTVTLGLAGAAAARGLRTLVVDLDPQANATAALDTGEHEFTSGDVLADARAGIAADAITPTGWGPQVDVIAADRALEHRNVPEGRDSSLRLRVALSGLETRYDLVLVDSPPSLGELTRNALAAVDRALVVTEPGYFALQGAAQALDAVSVVRSAANLGLRPVGIVVNRVRSQHAEHAFRLTELREVYGSLVLDPVVPDRSCIQQAQGAGVAVQTWRTPAAREVSDVFDRLLTHVLAAR
ncbi:MAG: ParA family protein [Candidatus Nanopelagicales bacterium]